MRRAAVASLLGVALGAATIGVILLSALVTGSNGAAVCRAELESCEGDTRCALHVFFAALTRPGFRQGAASIAIVFNVGVPAVLHMSLELPLLVAGAFCGLMQLVGISVVFPALFLPLHAYGLCARRRLRVAVGGDGGAEHDDDDVEQQHTSAALLCSLGIPALTLAMFVAPGHALALDLFNFAPLPIFAAVWLVMKGGIRLPRLMGAARAYDFIGGVANALCV
jgi:hypothetical protein